MRAIGMAVVLLACVAGSAARAEPQSGAGSRGPGFDPTGSHPLPNRSVERPEETGGPSGGCGCAVLAVSHWPHGAVLFGIATLLVPLRRRWQRAGRAAAASGVC